MADEHQNDDDSRNHGFEAKANQEDMGVDDGQSAEILDILTLLRTPKGRQDVLRGVIGSITPESVDPELWKRWLAGGAGPIERNKLAHPDPGGQSIQRALDRQSPRVAKAKEGVRKARRAFNAAQNKVEEAERELAEARSRNAALIQYAVSGHLTEIMAPMFAMGPAWTIMRAISAFVPPDMLTSDLSLVRPADQAAVEQRIRKEFRDGTDRIFAALDCWSGNVAFEYELRDAIEKVVGRFAYRDNPNPSCRTSTAMRSSLADPELQRHRDEILEGMKRDGN